MYVNTTPQVGPTLHSHMQIVVVIFNPVRSQQLRYIYIYTRVFPLSLSLSLSLSLIFIH
jgi:hypothetical protein